MSEYRKSYHRREVGQQKQNAQIDLIFGCARCSVSRGWPHVATDDASRRRGDRRTATRAEARLRVRPPGRTFARTAPRTRRVALAASTPDPDRSPKRRSGGLGRRSFRRLERARDRRGGGHLRGRPPGRRASSLPAASIPCIQVLARRGRSRNHKTAFLCLDRSRSLRGSLRTDLYQPFNPFVYKLIIPSGTAAGCRISSNRFA